MTTLGVCTAGVEAQFEAALISRAKEASAPMTYLEIGLENGGTFKAVHSILTKSSLPFDMVGIEPGPDYAKASQHLSHVTILNCTRQEAANRFPHRIDFAFIDGCHSFSCATGDFQFVESCANSGCIVIFHDFGEGSIGQNQTHCNEISNVRRAVKELGLFDDTRPGWKRLPDWKGDYARNGADCGVFRKT